MSAGVCSFCLTRLPTGDVKFDCDVLPTLLSNPLSQACSLRIVVGSYQDQLTSETIRQSMVCSFTLRPPASTYSQRQVTNAVATRTQQSLTVRNRHKYCATSRPSLGTVYPAKPGQQTSLMLHTLYMWGAAVTPVIPQPSVQSMLPHRRLSIFKKIRFCLNKYTLKNIHHMH